MTEVQASPTAAEAAAIAHAGGYLEAAERCRAALEGSPADDDSAALVAVLERLAYILRPQRGDALSGPFTALPTILRRTLAGGSLGPCMRARVLAAQARLTAWQDPAEGLPLAREALRVADESGDADARFLALFALHYGLENPDFAVERRSVSAAMLAAARIHGGLEEQTIAHWRSIVDAWSAADSAGYDFHLARFLAGAEMLGDAHWRAMAASARAARAIYEGEYDVGRQEAAAATESGIPAAADAAVIQLVVASVDQGRARELNPAIFTRQAAARALYLPLRIGVASLLMASGRITEARAEVELAPLDQLAKDGSYLPAVCLSGDLAIHLGLGRGVMDQVRDMLLPYAGRNAVMGDGAACFGPVDLYLGCLSVERGDMEASRVHMEAGYRIAARMRGRPWLARMSRDLAETFGGDPEGPGIEWAKEALEIAEELGMAPEAARAREVLRGAAPSTPVLRPAEDRLGKGLTPRETEILTLLAAGRTASAIANELILSTRTVQKHIEHIYEKIGVQTRHELVGYAIRQGLIPD